MKLDNLLLDEHNQIRITDFGFACFVYDDSRKRVLTDTQCGTLEYMAPEILKGLKSDPRISDVWSSGIILFEMLTGDVPFRVTKNNQALMIRKQEKKDWKFPPSFDKPISQTVRELTSQLLEPQLTKRIMITAALNHTWFVVGDPKS